MRPFINSLHLDDYQDMESEVKALQTVFNVFINEGHLFIVVPHEHRYWEYGSVLKMILDKCNESSEAGNALSNFTYLDVGSGWSLMGPALSYLYNVNVTECEPSPREFADRVTTNGFLRSRGKKELRVLPNTTENLPDEKYDMVACISVIEHLPADVEARCWKNLVDRIKPGGLFFCDVDCVPDQSKSYVFDEMRAHNFTCEEMKDRVNCLKALGMEQLSGEDYNWNGAQVHDFTFFRIGMRKI